MGWVQENFKRRYTYNEHLELDPTLLGETMYDAGNIQTLICQYPFTLAHRD